MCTTHTHLSWLIINAIVFLALSPAQTQLRLLHSDIYRPFRWTSRPRKRTIGLITRRENWKRALDLFFAVYLPHLINSSFLLFSSLSSSSPLPGAFDSGELHHVIGEINYTCFERVFETHRNCFGMRRSVFSLASRFLIAHQDIHMYIR